MLGWEKRELEDEVVRSLEELESALKHGNVGVHEVREELGYGVYRAREKVRDLIERLDEAERKRAG
jgi:hypothetical protein